VSEPADIPQTNERRTEPTGLVLSAISGLRQTIPALIAMIFVLRDQGHWLLAALPIALALLGVSAFFAWLQWHRLTYRLGAEDIRVESGVLSRAARSVPYERIQDVSLEQGPIARVLGLVEVRFETGAGGKDELKLAYLKEAEGERLREVVRERKDDAVAEPGKAEAGAGEPPAEVLFAMEPRRLITFGLFEFSLAVVAVVAGAVQQLDFLLPFDPWDFDEWQQRLAGPGSWLSGLGRTAQVVGGIIAAGSLLLLGFATGLVRTVLRDWGFTLERTAKGFRRRRGLLTRTDVVMPAHRVQALAFRTGIVRRRFGWHGLKFVSLAQDAGASSHDVAPFARWDELQPIARAAGFAMPTEDLEWHRAGARYRIDSALMAGVIAGGIALAVLVALSATGAASPLLALIPLGIALPLAAWQWFLWRFERHTLDAAQVYARHGWLAPRTDVASRVKLHSAEIAQGPIARRRGYATLHLGLAGGKLAIEGIPLARARELRAAIVRSITAQDFSRIN
jgi:putative membrane protein